MCFQHNELRTILVVLIFVFLFVLGCFLVARFALNWYVLLMFDVVSAHFRYPLLIILFNIRSSASDITTNLYSKGIFFALAFTVGAVFLSLVQIRQHRKNFLHPPSQRHLIWILGKLLLLISEQYRLCWYGWNIIRKRYMWCCRLFVFRNGSSVCRVCALNTCFSRHRLTFLHVHRLLSMLLWGVTGDVTLFDFNYILSCVMACSCVHGWCSGHGYLPILDFVDEISGRSQWCGGFLIEKTPTSIPMAFSFLFSTKNGWFEFSLVS